MAYIDFLSDLMLFVFPFYEYYIYHALLGAVVLCSLIQGKTARGLLWIAGTLLCFAGAITLIKHVFPPTENEHSVIISTLVNSSHIVSTALLVWLCAIFLRRQPSFHLQLTLSIAVIMLLFNLSYLIEAFVPQLSDRSPSRFILLMTLLDLLILLPLMSGVISGFIKPKAQLKTLSEQGGA